MVAVSVLLVCILGIFSGIAATHNAAKTISERNLAARKLRTVMEIAQTLPFGDVITTVSSGRVDFEDLEDLMDYNSSLPQSTTGAPPATCLPVLGATASLAGKPPVPPVRIDCQNLCRLVIAT